MRRVVSLLAIFLVLFSWVAPVLASEPGGTPSAEPSKASEEAGEKAHEAVHGEEAHGTHHAGSRLADEDHHWWIGKLIPISVREKVASLIGPSVLGEAPAKINVAHVFMIPLVVLIGLGLAFAARGAILRAREDKLPPKKWGAFAFFDIFMEAILGLMLTMMPRERALKFLPLVTAAAVFILISNLLGLIPGFVPPTQSLNTTIVLGVIAFLYYNYQGIRHVGLLKYLKHFMGPLLLLAPLMIVIEVISHTVRPLSLGLRLMGNMFGDHQVLFIFMSFGLPLIPLPLMALGLMVCVVQTVVFTLLFVVYLSLATADHEHHDDEHHADEGHGHAAAAH